MSTKGPYNWRGKEYKSVAELAAAAPVKIKRTTLHFRLRQGMSIDEAMTTPARHYAQEKPRSSERKNVRLFSYRGQMLTLPELYALRPEENAITLSGLRHRLENGWDVETAIEKPVLRPEERLNYREYKGKRMHIKDIYAMHAIDIDYKTFCERIRSGWSAEDAIAIPVGEMFRKPVVNAREPAVRLLHGITNQTPIRRDDKWVVRSVFYEWQATYLPNSIMELRTYFINTGKESLPRRRYQLIPNGEQMGYREVREQ